VFLSPCLRSVEEMKENIAAALSAIDSDMLQRVWDTLDDRINVSCDTGCSY
jgi:hypothetical protein